MLRLHEVVTYYGSLRALKGVTLRAKDASPDLRRSINLVADELTRQVKRHRDKRRKRREQRASASAGPVPEAPGGESFAV